LVAGETRKVHAGRTARLGVFFWPHTAEMKSCSDMKVMEHRRVEQEKAPRFVAAGPVVEMFMKTAARIDRHRGKIETARHGACESFGTW
jgi:hypothetical protein